MERVKAVKQKLGPDICMNILFRLSLLGCDTTSHVYGPGKGASLNKFNCSSDICVQAKEFDTQSASTNDVVIVGENALLCLYDSKPTEHLNSL